MALPEPLVRVGLVATGVMVQLAAGEAALLKLVEMDKVITGAVMAATDRHGATASHTLAAAVAGGSKAAAPVVVVEAAPEITKPVPQEVQIPGVVLEVGETSLLFPLAVPAL